jgi:hypothetical protein
VSGLVEFSVLDEKWELDMHHTFSTSMIYAILLDFIWYFYFLVHQGPHGPSVHQTGVVFFHTI